MKKAVVNACLSIVSVLVAFLLMEGIAQVYVYKIARMGKLFEPDALTGWRVKPQIEMLRKNADGDIWTIRTDENGLRQDSYWGLDTRVLILGDSFAFGEGVDVQDRFDQKLKVQGYSVLNTGVMGYGTDQQFLIARPYLTQLDQGDIAIVLTHANDFFDITRRQHSGRAKPWYDISDGKLRLHKPGITPKAIMRDKSYILALLGSLTTEHDATSDSEIAQATKIYKMLMTEELAVLASRGVRVVLAHHGVRATKTVGHRNQIARTLEAICENGQIHCLDIDEHFDAVGDGEYFLSDGHWNQKAHEEVGALLAEMLVELEAESGSPEL